MVPGHTIDIWRPRSSRPSQTTHWRIGPLDLWVRQVGEEWRVGEARAEEGRAVLLDNAEPETDIEWRRWAGEITGPQLKVTPLLPDRSVIVRPGTPIQILPGHDARFFVGVPVWVGLSLVGEQSKEVQLCEEHTIQLSKSWFGTPATGELCYALRTRAKRNLAEIEPAPHRVVCPLLLRNRSDTALDFQRLCLRARHLNIYQGARHMLTNEGQVTFKGEEELSHVSYGNSAPPFDGANERLGGPRDRAPKGFVSRAFDNLKAFAPFE